MPIPAMVIDPLAPPPQRDGLFLAATGPLDLPAHANTAGLTYELDSCGQDHLYPTPCQTPPYPSLVLDAGDGLQIAYPFQVYASLVCGAFGHSNAEAEKRLRTRFAVGEQTAVETALWGGKDGVTGIFQQIATAGGNVAVAASASVVEAVSLLEQQIAGSYNGPVTIHARPRMAAYFGKNGQIRPTKDGQPDRTYFGSNLSFGGGYAGTGPAAEAVGATTEYIFASGRVIIWRSPEVWVSPADALLDKTTNQRGMYAVRTYAVAVECKLSSTLVTRA